MRIRQWLWPSRLIGKLAVLLLCLLAVASGWYFYSCYRVGERVEAAWKISDELGLPRTLAELRGPEPPESENGAAPLQEAFEIAVKIGIQASDGLRDELFGRVSPRDPKYAENIVLLVTGAPEFEERLREADARPTLRFAKSENDWKRRDVVVPFESVARAELYRAQHQAKFDDREGAVRRLLRLLRMTERWQRGDPNFHVLISCHWIREPCFEEIASALVRGKFPPAVHDEIEATAAMTETLAEDFVRAIQEDKIELTRKNPNVVMDGLPNFRLRQLYDEAWGLPLIGRWQVAIRRHGWKSEPDGKEIDREFQMGLHSIWTKYLHVASNTYLWLGVRARLTVGRSAAEARCLRTLNALALKSDWKTPLASLGLPPEATTDPFDDKPLRIKQTQNGPIVYSVGPNLKDDDGAKFEHKYEKGVDDLAGDVGLRQPSPERVP